MYKLLQYHTQVNATLGTTLRQLRHQLLSVIAIHPTTKLSAHIKYDIGLNDCRPELPTFESIQRTEAAQLNEIRSRLI